MKFLHILQILGVLMSLSISHNAQDTPKPSTLPPYLTRLESILKKRAMDEHSNRSLFSLRSPMKDEDTSDINNKETLSNISRTESQLSDKSSLAEPIQENSQSSLDNNSQVVSDQVSNRSSDLNGNGSGVTVNELADVSSDNKSVLSVEDLSLPDLKSGQSSNKTSNLEKLDSGIDKSAKTDQSANVQIDLDNTSGQSQLDSNLEGDLNNTSRESEAVEDDNKVLITKAVPVEGLDGDQVMFSNQNSADDTKISATNTSGLKSTNKTIISNNLTKNNMTKDQELDSLSDLVHDFANEAADSAIKDYKFGGDDLSASGLDMGIPKVAVVNNQPNTLISSQPDKEVPSELIDDILRSAQQKRARSHIIQNDQDADVSSFLMTSPQNLDIQRIPAIQNVGDDFSIPMASEINTATHTSVDPIDNSVTHHQLNHIIHEDPVTGKQVHTLQGTSVNVGRRTPFDALIGGLLNMFKGRSQKKEESPVVVMKGHPNALGMSSTKRSDINPFSQLQSLFNFGKPNQSANDYSDYSDDHLREIMDSLKDDGDNAHHPNPLTDDILLHANDQNMQLDSDVNNQINLSQAIPLDLDVNHHINISQDLGLDSHQNILPDMDHGDLSEGDEILYHSGNHDNSVLSQEHDGNDVIDLMSGIKPSNRIREDDLPEHLSIDEDQVLNDHLNQKSMEERIRQQAVNDLMNQIIGSTDFSTVSSGSQRPLMGQNYSTSNLGLSSNRISNQAGPIKFSSSHQMMDNKHTDIDDLISSLQGKDLTLGLDDKKVNATDQYLLNVLSQTGIENSESDDLNPSDREFFKALKDDTLDINANDHKILKEGSHDKNVITTKNIHIDSDEDLKHRLMNPILQGKKKIGDDKGINIMSSHEIMTPSVIKRHRKKILSERGPNEVLSQAKKRISVKDLGMGINAGNNINLDNSSNDIKNKNGLLIATAKANSNGSPHITQFGNTQFPPGQFNIRSHHHRSKSHSTTTTTVDTTELTQVLSQLAQAFGGRRHRHHHHRHHRHHGTRIHSSTNIHINQGSSVNKSNIHSSSVEKNTSVSKSVRKKENKIVNIENVIHHIYRQPKRKQKINIKVTVKPMPGFKSSGPCEDNCEEEINKHIEEIMDLENTKSSPSHDSSLSHVSENTQNLSSSQKSEVDQESVVSVPDENVSSQQSEVDFEAISPGTTQESAVTDDFTSSIEPHNDDENVNRMLLDVDNDFEHNTFYNNMDGEERRLAQMEFRRSIQKIKH